jgi:hypothetical protein
LYRWKTDELTMLRIVLVTAILAASTSLIQA